MKRVPYIGITGFMTRQEVDEVMSVIPQNSNHKFMVGVLASPKTISGAGNKWVGRYPFADEIGKIFSGDKRAFNLIHYGDGLKSSEGLGKTLISVREQFGGPNMHGYQLNMAWPKGKEIAEFKEKYPEMQIVLQAGRWALEDSTDSALAMVRRFREAYPNGEVDYLILDISGGLGVPLSPSLMVTNLKIMQAAALNVSYTAAGGLHKGNLHLVDRVVEICPDISLDAEGALRDPMDDSLIMSEAIGYTKGAYEKLGRISF
jgi:hypothetical protein